jgi:hypothetical protein
MLIINYRSTQYEAFSLSIETGVPVRAVIFGGSGGKNGLTKGSIAPLLPDSLPKWCKVVLPEVT